MDIDNTQHQVPIPSHLSCVLIVKIGPPQSSRTIAGTQVFEHTTTEGCEVLLHRVGKFVDTIADVYAKAKTTPNKVVTLVKTPVMDLFAKIGANDRQAAFAPIDSTTYQDVIRRMWRSLTHRANGVYPYHILGVLMYGSTLGGRRSSSLCTWRSRIRAQQIRRLPRLALVNAQHGCTLSFSGLSKLILNDIDHGSRPRAPRHSWPEPASVRRNPLCSAGLRPRLLPAFQQRHDSAAGPH